MSFPLPLDASLIPSRTTGSWLSSSLNPRKWAPPVEVKPPTLKGVFVASYLGLDASRVRW